MKNETQIVFIVMVTKSLLNRLSDIWQWCSTQLSPNTILHRKWLVNFLLCIEYGKAPEDSKHYREDTEVVGKLAVNSVLTMIQEVLGRMKCTRELQEREHGSLGGRLIRKLLGGGWTDR